MVWYLSKQPGKTFFLVITACLAERQTIPKTIQTHKRKRNQQRHALTKIKRLSKDKQHNSTRTHYKSEQYRQSSTAPPPLTCRISCFLGHVES